MNSIFYYLLYKTCTSTVNNNKRTIIMPFQAGQSGNPKGRPKGSLSKSGMMYRDKITRLIVNNFSDNEVYNVLYKVYEAAINGDMSACRTFLEYTMIKADKLNSMEEQEKPSLFPQVEYNEYIKEDEKLYYD